MAVEKSPPAAAPWPKAALARPLARLSRPTAVAFCPPAAALAPIATDAGDAPFYLCTNNVQGGTQCQAGPLPDTINRAYPDGGVAIRFFTDGGSAPDVAHLQIVFNPARPGTYNQHVIVDSTATDHPEIVLNVTGRAVTNH